MQLERYGANAVVNVTPIDGDSEHDEDWRATVRYLREQARSTSDTAISIIMIATMRMCFFSFLDWPNKIADNNGPNGIDVDGVTHSFVKELLNNKRAFDSFGSKCVRPMSCRRNNDDDAKHQRSFRLYVKSQTVIGLLEHLSTCDLQVRSNGQLIVRNGADSMRRDLDKLYNVIKLVGSSLFAHICSEATEYAERHMDVDDRNEAAATIIFALLSKMRHNGAIKCNDKPSNEVNVRQFNGSITIDPRMEEFEVFVQHSMYRLSRVKMSQVQVERFADSLTTI